MKISTRSRYGLKICQLLAEEYSPNTTLALPYIAEKLSLSEPYLEQLIAILKKNGIVCAIRGAGGGYYLSRNPEEITIGDIIRPLEGDFELNDCLTEGCENQSKCKAKSIWKKLYAGINDILDSMTLKEMIDEEV